MHLLPFVTTAFVMCNFHCAVGRCSSLKWKEFQGACYLRSDDKLKFFDNVALCQSLEASVVSIHNQEENEFVLQQFCCDPYDMYLPYIGVRRETLESNWTWHDGTALDFSDFYPGKRSISMCSVCHTYNYKFQNPQSIGIICVQR